MKSGCWVQGSLRMTDDTCRLEGPDSLTVSDWVAVGGGGSGGLESSSKFSAKNFLFLGNILSQTTLRKFSQFIQHFVKEKDNFSHVRTLKRIPLTENFSS